MYLVLRKRGGGNDICLGVPVVGRTKTELDPLIGFFVNTLVQRIREPDDSEWTIDDLISHAGKMIRDGLDHQDVPFEQILERLTPSRNLNRSPIFQVLVNYAPDPVKRVRFGSCELTPMFPESDSAKFELTFSLNEMDSEDLLIAVEYSSQLFKERTVVRLAEEVELAARSFLERPGTSVRNLCLLVDEEKRLVTEVWNRNAALTNSDRLLHEWLEFRALTSPKAVALVSDDCDLSYSALNEASNTLADQLRSWGVGHEELIAVYLPRSFQLIVAIFGILKAKGAFVPIALDDPPSRMEYILRDTSARIIIADTTTEPGIRSIAQMTHRSVILIDELNELSRNISPKSEAPIERNESSPLAYVLYTSGSTGRQKGVMVEHRSVSNHSAAVIEAYALTPEDRVGQFSIPTFDIFIEEVFPTIRVGATLVILDNDCRRDPRALVSATHRHRLTVLNLPTAFFHLLANDSSALESISESLRMVIVGGEKLDAKIAKRFLHSRPEIRLVNTYGPTEATVICTTHTLDSASDDGDIPIGKPIAGTEVYVLNQDRNPTPPGVPGELYIGGAGVARGYLNLPDLTEDRFVPHITRTGDRLYRTGDRCYWDESGNLRYVGRTDQQIKVRGFRVEPGEVDSAILQDPRVDQAAVFLQTAGANQQLVALIVPQKNQSIDLETFRRRLSDLLPEYMIPSRFDVVQSLPMTANGKLDRQAIVQRQMTEIDLSIHVTEETALEKKMLGVWSEILNVFPIHVDDEFFAIGGHSLLAVQVVRRIESEWGIPVQVADLFRHSTVRRLSQFLASKKIPEPSRFDLNGSILLRSAAVTFILPGLPGIGDYYFDLADGLETDGPVLSLSLPGYAGDQPSSSIEEIAKIWSSQINKACEGQSVRFIAHSYAGTVLYEMLRAGLFHDIEIDSVILVDSLPHSILRKSIGPYGLDEWWMTIAEAIPHAPEVITAALRANYHARVEKLDRDVHLVIAEESRSWLDPSEWKDYFRHIQVHYALGDHMSIVKRPDCLRWTREIRSAKVVQNTKTLSNPPWLDAIRTHGLS